MKMIIQERLINLLEKEKNYDYENQIINYGFCFDCFINQDKDFQFLMNTIKNDIQSFDKEFIKIYKNNLRQELELIYKKIEIIENKSERKSTSIFHSPIIKQHINNLNTLSVSQYLHNYQYSYTHLPFSQIYPNVMNAEYIKEYEPFYSMVKYFFNQYKEDNTPFINFDELENIKKQLNDIYTPEKYIDKYNLLKLSNFHHLYVSYKGLSYIADYKEQRYFYNQYIPVIVFEVIKHLINKKYVEEISFLITDITEHTYNLEEKEFGTNFNYNLNTLPPTSSFYDEQRPDNKLIVKKKLVDNKISLTFETLKDDFINQNNYIITNLIHIEIETINNEDYISHLDHEFIFYELSEYENKINDYSKKGFKKVKTFKIDNSRIPLSYKYKNTPILIYFLIELLDNTNLIEEYFSKLNEIKYTKGH